VGKDEVRSQKGGVDAVSVVAFAYDFYTNPSKNNGVLRATLTLMETIAGLFPQILVKFLPGLILFQPRV
jgi:hypothetical protein